MELISYINDIREERALKGSKILQYLDDLKRELALASIEIYKMSLWRICPEQQILNTGKPVVCDVRSFNEFKNVEEEDGN